MDSASPTRPTRRTARRAVVADDSDDDVPEQSTVLQDEEDDFTPAPKRSPRKSTRRQTTVGATSPQKSTRNGRRAKTGESIEPSQIFDQEASFAVPTEPASPSKRASPRRKSAAPSRNTRKASGIPAVPALPTPTPSKSPEPMPEAFPLTDITNRVNRSPPSPVIKNENHTPPLEAMIEKSVEVVSKPSEIIVPIMEPPAGPTSRMVIQQLVMTNFKSYAGRQVVGPFHVSFSSVVGPNGSGKSNVIDSLLFVFGFRASKMRQGKISALIHNSAQFQDLRFCEVEVHFQEIIDLPGGGHEVVPDTQLMVSRKAFKDNTSNYYLNGRTATFTTVTNLLKNKGIDLDHKRFLILQGEVESIAQMKPKAANEHDDGLLEYLEDIIGTSKYKTPIEEAAAELETVNEVCVEKQSRVQHVEKEKNGLEDKKNKALAYIRDENELAEKQSTLYQIYMAECEDNAKVTEEAIEQMQAQLDAELEKHAGGEDQIKQLEKAYKKGAKEFDGLEKSTQAYVKEMAKFDKENVKFEEKRKFIANKQKKAEKAELASRLAAADAERLVQKHKDDIVRKTADVAELETDMGVQEKELSAIRESLKGKTQGLSDQITSKQRSLEPWKQKVNEKESAIALVKSELELVKEKANAGAVALDEAKVRIATLEEGQVAKSFDIKQTTAEKATLEKEAGKIRSKLQDLSKEEPTKRSKVTSARQKADEARASLASSQNQGNVLQGLMRLKDSGRIDGFHGRLGNLGTIDEKFDVAISTACPALENMVVDTVEVGQQCIDYLRKNNLGRANFILLDRLAKRDLSRIATPEIVPRLFDLVKPKNPNFAPAFFSVMQNTLVADDLEQANRIAYGSKRWRVVTLDGQLIDVSGTMSGGGTRVARGAMSSKLAADTTKEQVQKLESLRDQLEQGFDTFQAEQQELETRLNELMEEIPRLDTLLEKAGLEVDSGTRNLADAQRRLQEVAAEYKGAKTDDGQIKALDRQILRLEKELEKLHSETASVEEEIQTLQDKIMEVGGVKLRGQKARVDGLKEQISLLGDEISNAEVDKTKNEKIKVKHEKAQGTATKDIANLEKESGELEENVASQAADSSAAKNQAEEAQESLEVKKEELAALKVDLDTQVKELNSTRAVEIEMRNKLEENQKILGENCKKRRYWNEKIAKLTLHDIADLEGGKSGPEETEENQNVEASSVAQTEDSDKTMTQSESQSQSHLPTNQLPTYTRDELEDKSKDHLLAAIATLEEKTSNASAIDLNVVAEYRRRATDLALRTTDLNSALSTRDVAKTRLTELRNTRLTTFLTGFHTISSHLKTMYQLITLGGNAELELVDSLDPFSEGILFSVMPPKKSWKNISNLSGGEKTLSSLALVFALHVYRPTPLYVMDEIDAALDFRNVSIVASYIKERTKNAQFIVISLRNNMFELAERLVGIYKVNHMTKSVTVENRDYLNRG